MLGVLLRRGRRRCRRPRRSRCCSAWASRWRAASCTFDALAMKFREIKLPRDPTCPICGDGQEAREHRAHRLRPVLQRQELDPLTQPRICLRERRRKRAARRGARLRARYRRLPVRRSLRARAAGGAGCTLPRRAGRGRRRRWRRGSRRTATARTLTPPEESALLIEVARPLGAFVARLFGVEPARQAQLDTAAREAAIFRMKHFIVRRASKKYPEDKLPGRRSGGAARPRPRAARRRRSPSWSRPATTS